MGARPRDPGAPGAASKRIHRRHQRSTATAPKDMNGEHVPLWRACTYLARSLYRPTDRPKPHISITTTYLSSSYDRWYGVFVVVLSHENNYCQEASNSVAVAVVVVVVVVVIWHSKKRIDSQVNVVPTTCTPQDTHATRMCYARTRKSVSIETHSVMAVRSSWSIFSLDEYGGNLTSKKHVDDVGKESSTQE